MQRAQAGTTLLLTAVLAVGLATVPAAQPPTGPPGQGEKEINVRRLKPRWKVGDRWIVQTRTMQMQARRQVGQDDRGQPVQWQFQVQGTEKLAGTQCYKVEIKCLAESAMKPSTTIWVDAQTMALRQTKVELPTQGGSRSVTESYEFPGGQPAPVLGPLTALPLDLPLFLDEGTKATSQFVYETYVGPAGTKAIGEIGFTRGVRQDVGLKETEGVKSLLDEQFVKSLPTDPLVEVQLSSQERSVRQLWQAGGLWPAYSDNGVTQAKLLRVLPPATPGRGEQP